MADIGDIFKSGEIVSVSGEYQYVAHVNPTSCLSKKEERQIALKQGERFPSHTCLRWVEWQLIRPPQPQSKRTGVIGLLGRVFTP